FAAYPCGQPRAAYFKREESIRFREAPTTLRGRPAITPSCLVSCPLARESPQLPQPAETGRSPAPVVTSVPECSLGRNRWIRHPGEKPGAESRFCASCRAGASGRFVRWWREGATGRRRGPALVACALGA